MEFLNKITFHLWNNRNSIAKYGFTGSSAFVLDMVSLIFLKEIAGFSPTFSIILGQIFVLLYVFLINKYWSFKKYTWKHYQIVRFLALASFNYLFSVSSMFLFNEIFGFNYIIIRVFTVAVMVCWNYILYRTWIYI